MASDWSKQLAYAAGTCIMCQCVYKQMSHVSATTYGPIGTCFWFVPPPLGNKTGLMYIPESEKMFSLSYSLANAAL